MTILDLIIAAVLSAAVAFILAADGSLTSALVAASVAALSLGAAVVRS